MTQEFRELTSLLAKGNNFPENAYLLGVLTDEGEDNCQLHIRAKDNKDEYGVMAIICGLIKELLIACDNTEARAIREAIISVIQEDEQRRFNDMEIKRYEGQNS